MAETSSKALKNGGNSRALKNGGNSPHPHPHHDTFFPRLSYRENFISSTPNGDGSFRVLYYGGAGSVPFTWESRPGTPKQTSEDRGRAPPLTPPPSYQLGSPRANHPSRKKHHHLPKSSKICKSIFSRNRASKKSDVVPTFSPSSSQSSSSYSLPSPPPKARSPSAARLGLGLDEPEPSSPSSTLCFGPRSNGDSRMIWDYYDPIKNVKKMVLSMVGHAKNN